MVQYDTPYQALKKGGKIFFGSESLTNGPLISTKPHLIQSFTMVM